MNSLSTCDAPPHLQQASFLPGSVQPRDTWPYPWHLKHRATSTCSRMRQFTQPTLSLPSAIKLRASASVKRTTAVFRPPKRLYSMHWSSRSGLPSAMHSLATTSSLGTVSSRSLTYSRHSRRPRRYLTFSGPGGSPPSLFFGWKGPALPNFGVHLGLHGFQNLGSVSWRCSALSFLGQPILGGRRSILLLCRLFESISQRRRTRSPKDTHPFRGVMRFQLLLDFHPAI